jgi:ADP-heptose:LPS heptosyltransferase
MKIIISPYSRGMRVAGKLNPKNYPYWEELVKLLNDDGHIVIQVGVGAEQQINGTSGFLLNQPLDKLREILNATDTWISVDNFFQHFAWYYGKKGIVLFGQSDPLIFGHNTNINLLKGREYLRPLQFDMWERAEYREDVFVDPSIVLKHIRNMETNNL